MYTEWLFNPNTGEVTTSHFQSDTERLLEADYVVIPPSVINALIEYTSLQLRRERDQLGEACQALVTVADKVALKHQTTSIQLGYTLFAELVNAGEMGMKALKHYTKEESDE